MASVYPSALDSFATNRVDGTVSATTHAQDHDNENDAINKIEAELGLNPRGTSATVAARLTAMTAATAAAQASADATTVAASLQTGTAYTLVIGDQGKVVEMNNAAANVVTVPNNSSVAFPIGTLLEIFQVGAGQTSIAAAAGVTLLSPGAKLKITGQYSSATLRKRGTNEWTVEGDLTT